MFEFAYFVSIAQFEEKHSYTSRETYEDCKVAKRSSPLLWERGHCW